TLERLILHSLRNILQAFNPATLAADLERMQRLIGLGQQLNLNVSLAQAQEFYLRSLHNWIVPQCIAWIAATQDLDKVAAYGKKSEIRLTHLRSLLGLGQMLAIDVTGWLAQLP
ncbi:MAG: glycoside hydrolase, partial [Leptolyngbyaceae cyanobacterium CAN_BIN12]|nr:glycoside hydrolase [Leptolyngbyaceae cyanobacterium CAN_BIN12]